MAKISRYKNWVLDTYAVESDCLHEECHYGQPRRTIRLYPVFPPKFQPYYRNAKRWELVEEWASFEDPDYLVKGEEWRQVDYDKAVCIASFEDIDEGKFILRLLFSILNAPNGNALCHEISPILMKAFAAFPAELEKVRAQEEKEAEELAAKLEAERIQREIARVKKELAREEARKIKQAALEAKQKAKEERARIKREMQGGDHVYVIKFEPLIASKDYIKIGHSINVSQRSLSVKGGLDILGIRFTKAITNSQACDIEKMCHEHFASRRKPGTREYFFVSYEEACAYLRSLVDSDLVDLVIK